MIIMLIAVVFLAVMGFLPGCGSGWDSSVDSDPDPKDKTEVEKGEVTVAIKDAPCDDIDVFEVDVLQLTFTKANGAVVTVLPESQRVNFADLTDMAELLIGTYLPKGFYTKLTMTLDFSNAVVLLDGAEENADIFDEDGNPITGVIDVDLEFGEGALPYVNPCKAVLFMCDLDLNSSVTVDIPGNNITFEPVISCTVDPDEAHPIIGRGRLSTVVPEKNEIILVVRSLITKIPLCYYTVSTDSETIFHVNGKSYKGSEGLAAVAALPKGTPIWSHGTITLNSRVLSADFVVAGLAVPGHEIDCVVGHIIARDAGAGQDPVLTVLGRGYDYDTQSWTFNQTWTVRASFTGTKVLKWRNKGLLDTDYLNIGQRIKAFGELIGTELDATGEIDKGVIRTVVTDVWGFANGPAEAGELNVDVSRFGHRHISRFDFNVDGTSVADPAAFVIDVGTMGLADIDADTPLRVRGFVAPVTASESDPDYTATAVVDRSSAGSFMVIKYFPANPDPCESISGTGITMDISLATCAAVNYGFAGTIPLDTAPSPQIVPEKELGIYTIIQNGALTGFLNFEYFAQALEARLANGATMRKIASLGKYDYAEQKMSAFIVTVVLK
jgi:hypothetical protein